MSTRKTTTTREYDDKGRLVKEIVVTEDQSWYQTTNHGRHCACSQCRPSYTWTFPATTTIYQGGVSVGTIN